MLFNNYLQVLDILQVDAEILKNDLKALHLMEANLECWWKEQEEHFQGLGSEAEEDVHSAIYVELLQKLNYLEYISYSYYNSH